jgi:hypothetical protein
VISTTNNNNNKLQQMKLQFFGHWNYSTLIHAADPRYTLEIATVSIALHRDSSVAGKSKLLKSQTA